MNLIKTSLLNSVAVAVRILTLLGINKILAVYVGPAGYAAIGQLHNAVQMITVFASGAINTGVTKYTAEYHDDEEKQHAVWRTAGTIAAAGALVTGMIILIFSGFLSKLFLKDENYAYVFVWFSVLLIFLVLNNLLLAVLNGQKNIRLYVVSNIASSIFSALITAALAITHGLSGALIALVAYQSLAFFVTAFLCRKKAWFRLSFFFGKVDASMLAKLAKYMAMALTSAACVPVSHLFIRNYLGEAEGWEAAGHWEAMWRLSSAYLMFVTATLSVYYLPRLSELKESAHIRKEILHGYKIILPVAGLAGLLMYVLRDFIIVVLFTDDFYSMRNLFFFQMVGDFLKIGSWLLAYMMLGKAMTKQFISTEILFAGMFVALSFWGIHRIGVEGVVVAYAINYALYWVVVVGVTRKIWGAD